MAAENAKTGSTIRKLLKIGELSFMFGWLAKIVPKQLRPKPATSFFCYLRLEIFVLAVHNNRACP